MEINEVRCENDHDSNSIPPIRTCLNCSSARCNDLYFCFSKIYVILFLN